MMLGFGERVGFRRIVAPPPSHHHGRTAPRRVLVVEQQLRIDTFATIHECPEAFVRPRCAGGAAQRIAVSRRNRRRHVASRSVPTLVELKR